MVMFFCQLGRARYLRETAGGLQSCQGKLKHLSITAPTHSTLSYANAHSPWELYQEIFFSLFTRIRSQLNGKKKFRFKNKLLTLYSTIIALCLSLFNRAQFRRIKGAIKLHLLLDHDCYLASYACITEGSVADVKIAQVLRFDPGTVIVDNRAYE